MKRSHRVGPPYTTRLLPAKPRERAGALVARLSQFQRLAPTWRNPRMTSSGRSRGRARRSRTSTSSREWPAAAGWPPCSRRCTSGSIDAWRSRCSCRSGRTNPRWSSDSCARAARRRASSASTWCVCSTSARSRTARRSSSWSTWRATTSTTSSRCGGPCPSRRPSTGSFKRPKPSPRLTPAASCIAT